MPKVSLHSLSDAPPIEIDVARRTADGHEVFQVTVNGDSFEARVEWAAESEGILHLRNRAVRFFFTREEDVLSIWIEGRIQRFRVPRRLARRSESAGPALPAGDLMAPMPGTILKINVRAGDAFTAHQPLIIMESMKMEMTLSSPRPGRVSEITCRVGELVELGKLLAKLEDMDDHGQPS